MRKTVIVLAVALWGSWMSAEAQTVTKTDVLNKSARQYASENITGYAKALRLAKKNGWLLSFRSRNGGYAKLVGVDANGLPRYYTTFNNTIAAATTGANQLWPGGSTGLALNGSTIPAGKLAIWDGGSPLTTHVELTGRILYKDTSAPIDHATHVAGTMIASGVNPIAKGMSFGAKQLVAYDFNNDVAEVTKEAPNLLISNHSYGTVAGWNFNTSVTPNRWEFWGRFNDNEDYKFGYYDAVAQAWDSIAYNAPFYLIVQAASNNRDQNGPAVGAAYYRFNLSGQMASAGNRPPGISNNDGYGIIPTDANAKNILTVGAVNGLPTGYVRAQDVVMSSFSSWGPTDDGRIKPDLVADGVNVTSSVATSNTSYAAFSGTSMATPNTSGSLFLLQEYYAKKNGGTFMRSATLKALAIHTADEAGTTPGPDYQFGWGLLDVKKAAAVITNTSGNHLISESTLNNGGTFSTSVIASGNGPLVATIVWTDPPGTVDNVNVLNNPAKKLMNDLDLRITQTGTGSIYSPWVLDPANPANAATKGDNNTDNVERINVDSVVPGQAYNISLSHKGNLMRGSQAYSLIISGIGGTAYCTSAPASTAGTRIDSVNFAGIANKTTAGCSSYRNFTNLTAQVEPNKTIPITVTLNSCDGTTASRVVKVYIDYNNNGVFTDPGELVATSTVIAGGAGTFTANITTASGLITGNYSIMRIVAQETTDTSAVKPCGAYGNGETEDYRINFIAPSNDVSVADIAAPLSNSCANTAQFVTVILKNIGTVDKTNIPLTATIKNGATTVATLTGTYPGTLSANTSNNFTFPTPFTSVAGITYTIIVNAAVPGDQDTTDNTNTFSIAIASKPSAPAGVAEICGTSVLLQVTNPNPASNYFWYTTAASTTPFASGTSTSTSTVTSDKNYYLATGIRASVGLPNKNVYPNGGGYQANGGNYMNYTATLPVTLETVRLYTRFPGQVTIIAADIVSLDTSSGSYTYLPLATTTITVNSTNPSPLAGAQTGNDPLDTGAVFLVNLPLPAGSHSLITITDANATIFRNNNVTGNPYPFNIPGVISITGNSAVSSSNPTNFQSFYYYLYDMRISTSDCPSDKTTVTAAVAPTPVVTQSGTSLTTTTTGASYQWYLNGNAIGGATSQSFAPTQAGTYVIAVTDALGCQRFSANFVYAPTAVANVNSAEIGLTATPNPSNGSFVVNFNVAARADVQVELINMAGQPCFSKAYSNFAGRFSEQYHVAVADGVYILKVQQNNKVYHQKLVIVH